MTLTLLSRTVAVYGGLADYAVQNVVLAPFEHYSFDMITAAESYQKQTYMNLSDVPTVAVGYALISNDGHGHYTAISLDALNKDFAATSHVFSQDEKDLLANIATQMSAGNYQAALDLFNARGADVLRFSLSDSKYDDGYDLFHSILNRNIVGNPAISTDDSIPAAIVTQLGFSYEMATLNSLVINNPALVGPHLEAAISQQDRAEAWYEIRYESNGGKLEFRNGLAARRYMESENFSLYNDNEHIELDEAKNVFQMFAQHREKMLSYDQSYGGSVSSANQNYATFLSAAGLTVHNRADSFAPALKVLLDTYASSADSTMKAGIKEVFVEFTPDSVPTNTLGALEEGSYVMDRRVGHGVVVNGTAEDLSNENALFIAGKGADEVHAGGGNDIIVATEDSLGDMLYGDEGDDVIFAGFADDRNVIDGGDGNDTLYYKAGADSGTAKQRDIVSNVERVETVASGGAENVISADVSNVKEWNTTSGRDVVEFRGSAAGGFFLDTYGGDDEVKFVPYGTTLQTGEGADKVELGNNIYFLDANPTDVLTWQGSGLTGGVRFWESENPWGYGNYCVGYGRNQQNDLVVASPFKNADGSLQQTFLVNFDPVAHTAGLYVIEVRMEIYRLIKGKPDWAQGLGLESAFETFLGQMSKAYSGTSYYKSVDPLVLDLDGDGIELTARSTIAPSFDVDKDGFAERTGWVKGDDGLLARDLNNNGKIDNVGELFGSKTTSGFEVPCAFICTAQSDFSFQLKH